MDSQRSLSKLSICFVIGLALVISSGCGRVSKTAGTLPSLDTSSGGSNYTSPEGLPAFPGAEGFGALAVGGRGGEVIEVTNLNASGPGSLREALEAKGPRIVVFRVGGTIELEKEITIKNPYVTIAGQTAPGDGICVKGAGINIYTHDVIMRGIRARIGDGKNGPPVDNRHAIQVLGNSRDVRNVILDHCSLSWGTDENITVGYEVENLTVQWSIISECLADAGHSDEETHSAGFLIAEDTDKVSVHHNLMAHNDWRNPLFKGGTKGEVINNVVYNWGYEGTRFTDDKSGGAIYCDIIGNYYKAGANMKRSNGVDTSETITSKTKLYMQGNIGPTRTNDTDDERAISNRPNNNKTSTRVCSSDGVTVQSAPDAYQLVLRYAGAMNPRRDPVDVRIVNDVKTGSGRFIDSQNDVGGWPRYSSSNAPQDTDHDGIPDNWELMKGLNPANKDDAKLIAASGYTWVEEYLNSLIIMPY